MLSEIFHSVWKLSIYLSVWDSPGCTKIFQAVQTLQESSRLFRNLPDCSGHFSYCWEIFQTVQKFSTLSWHLTDYWEIFNTVWKSSRLSGNLPDCLKIFQTFGKSSRLSRKFPRLYGNHSDCPAIFDTVRESSRLSGNLPDCPEIFQPVWKSSRLSLYIQYFFLKIVFSWKIYLNSKYLVCIFMKNFPDGQCYHVTEVFSLCLAGPQAPC